MASAYYALPVRDVAPSGQVDARLHVELRALPFEDGAAQLVAVLPASRYQLGSVTLKLNTGSDGSLREIHLGDTQMESPAFANLKSAVAELRTEFVRHPWPPGMAFRPALVTARDPELIGLLQDAIGGQGTSVQLVWNDELVDGHPLVGIMDGIMLSTVAGIERMMRGEQPFLDGAELRDTAVRPRKDGGFRTDRTAGDVPQLLWRCGACKKVMTNRAAKKCGKCLTAHYCSESCAKEQWATHKADCKQWRRHEPAAAARTAAPLSPSAWIKAGAAATLQQLQSQPALNGCTVEILGTVDETSGRVAVQVCDSGKQLRVKPANLVPAAAARRNRPGVAAWMQRCDGLGTTNLILHDPRATASPSHACASA